MVSFVYEAHHVVCIPCLTEGQTEQLAAHKLQGMEQTRSKCREQTVAMLSHSCSPLLMILIEHLHTKKNYPWLCRSRANETERLCLNDNLHQWENVSLWKQQIIQ